MKGLIYCFNTVGDSRIYKAGHTTRKLEKRLAGYMGPSKPRLIVFTRRVKDSASAERMMLKLMRQCVSITHRDDLGDEWFEANDAYTFEERQRQLEYIAKIVQLAIRGKKIPPEPMQQQSVVETQGCETTLRGLDEYFRKFDEYVREASIQQDSSPIVLMRNYEQSAFCPVNMFCNFLPFDEATRANVVKNRYRHLFTTVRAPPILAPEHS